MNPSLLLWSLIRAVAPVKGDGAQLAVSLSVGSALGALAGFVPPAVLVAIDALLEASAADTLRLGAAAAEVGRLSAALAQAAGDDAGRREAIAALTGQVEAIVALRVGGGVAAALLRHAGVDLATSPLTDLVAEWRLAATPEMPETIVARVPPEPAASVAVRLRGRSFAERRVAIRHHGAAGAPQLLLAAPSLSVRDRLPQARDDWQQRPFPDYDLAILTEQSRHKGTVVTRRLEGRVIARGASFTLGLEAPRGSAIISTEVLDETERPLARVLRWPPVAS